MDCAEDLVVVVALPVALCDLHFGKPARVELLELGEAVVSALCELEMC